MVIMLNWLASYSISISQSSNQQPAFLRTKEGKLLQSVRKEISFTTEKLIMITRNRLAWVHNNWENYPILSFTYIVAAPDQEIDGGDWNNKMYGNEKGSSDLKALKTVSG